MRKKIKKPIIIKKRRVKMQKPKEEPKEEKKETREKEELEEVNVISNTGNVKFTEG